MQVASAAKNHHRHELGVSP